MTQTPSILRGTVVLPDRLIPDGMVVFGDQIEYVGPGRAHQGPRTRLPADALILPGLVDIHCHGGGGAEFGADPEASRRAAEHHHRAGTTSVMASLVSAPAEALVAGMRTCGQLADEGVVVGIHTEGPFLAPSRCGAQDPTALIPVDLELVDALARAGQGHWRMMTLAPELPGADHLIARLAALNVRTAIGHTAATATVTANALRATRDQAGTLPIVTHLFNGMPPLDHRNPGPVAAALSAAATGNAVVELIADGVHLDDAIVAMVMELAAPDAAVFVTDAMSAAGMPDGHYALGQLDVVVSNGAARLADNGALAGGVLTMLDLVRRAVSHIRLPIARAVAAASHAPAKAFGLDDTVGSLRPGLRADVLVTTPDLKMLRVWRGGKPVGR